MSGLRNYGQVLNKNAERSELNPSDSRINFAVPAQKNLYRKEDKLLPIYPGIICDKHMQALAEKYSGMPLKLCVDGKKISRGKGKLIGDIDFWGTKVRPRSKKKGLNTSGKLII